MIYVVVHGQHDVGEIGREGKKRDNGGGEGAERGEGGAAGYIYQGRFSNQKGERSSERRQGEFVGAVIFYAEAIKKGAGKAKTGASRYGHRKEKHEGAHGGRSENVVRNQGRFVDLGTGAKIGIHPLGGSLQDIACHNGVVKVQREGHDPPRFFLSEILICCMINVYIGFQCAKR